MAWILICVCKHQADLLQHIQCPTIWCLPGNSVRLYLWPERRKKNGYRWSCWRTKISSVESLRTCSGPPESPWQESWPPVSCPAHKNISGMNSWRPARRNIVLHRSLLTIGTDTSCSTDGSVPPSLKRPQPVTEWSVENEEKFIFTFWMSPINGINCHLPVALRPMSKSSVAGKHMGAICGANSSGDSNLTSAKSYSYVKKLYFGCTTFFATARSTYGSSSCACEKSYSPTRMRICEVNRLKRK